MQFSPQILNLESGIGDVLPEAAVPKPLKHLLDDPSNRP